MNQENTLSTQNKLKKLRSNSIRNQKPLANIGLSAKLNSKKFPIDFFNQEHRKILAPRLLYSQRHNMQTNKGNKNLDIQLEEKFIQTLPEAQVTCFFKVSQNYSGTQDTNTSKNCQQQNETKVSISQFQCILTKQPCSLSQQNQKNQNIDLCWTFSRIPKSISKMGTPQTKSKQIQVKIQSVSQNSSAKFNRPMTRQQGRGKNMEQCRKGSMDKIDYKRNEVQDRLGNKRSVIKKNKIKQQINLPKIGKTQN